MNIGSLNRLVLIQRPTPEQDADGQPMTKWVNVASTWANVRTLSGIEAIKAGADTSVVKASIRIRARPGLNAGMRVVLRDMVYQINVVLPDEQARDRIDLACEVIGG